MKKKGDKKDTVSVTVDLGTGSKTVDVPARIDFVERNKYTILAMVVLTLSVALYWWSTQKQIKELSLTAAKKDETIRFISQENLSLKRQGQDKNRQTSLEVANLNQQLQQSREENTKLKERNQKQKETLLKWREFYDKYMAKKVETKPANPVKPLPQKSNSIQNKKSSK